MNPFPNELEYRNAPTINGKRHIMTTMPFRCITSLGNIIVPAGTISDGGSIPRFAYSSIGHPFDIFLEDCVLHDYLYSPANKEFSRAEADLIFRETMWNRNISRPRLIAMYCAVRMFGWRSFRGQPQ
jgi:hypothetical protein